MAKSAKRLGNATFVTYGYGQVEPNHMSAKRNGQVYAQLPANKEMSYLKTASLLNMIMPLPSVTLLELVHGVWSTMK